VLKKFTVLTRPTPARQDAPFRRQGRSEFRPESYPLGYVEGLNDATCLRETLRRRQGTPLADFFSTLLTGRPSHVSSAQDMEMQVKHSLAAMPTGIDDKAIPGIGNSFQYRNLVTGQYQSPK
jgi:hypothetical protein